MAGHVKGADSVVPGAPGGPGRPSIVAVGAMVIATATPYLIATLAPFLTDALRLSPVTYGVLAASSYGVAALASGTVGATADRADLKAGLVGLMGASLLSWVGLAAARGFWSALVAAAVGGIGLAASNPLTNRMVAEAKPRNYGLALGIKQAGVPLSAFLVGAAAPALATAWGWRLGLCSLAPVPVLLTAWGYRHVPRTRGPRTAAVIRKARATRSIRRLSMYAFLMGAGGGVLNAYVAIFAISTLHSSRTSAGFLVALLGAVGIGSRIAWAALSQRVQPVVLLLNLAVGATFSAGSLLAAGSLGRVMLVIACVVAGTTSVSWLGVAMVAVFRLSPGAIGSSTGSVSRGFYLGLMAAPIGGGLLLQHTHDYQPLWISQAVCFAGAAAVAFLIHRTPIHSTPEQ
ncbi:MAG: transporter [Streptosporangiaceae bacterium]|nr:transporter [Streptosporangiaceae bacterium]